MIKLILIVLAVIASLAFAAWRFVVSEDKALEGY